MKMSIARLKEIIMEEVTRATEGHDKDWGMGKDEKSRTRPGEEDYTGHKGDESSSHPGETDYEDEDEGEPEPHDVEGHAMRAMKAIYDLASAAGVELHADVGGPSDMGDEEEVEVELEDDE